jgi:hypothetical protein
MEGKRSKKRKRAKRLKFQKEKDDSPAVEEIDERKEEEEEEESSDCAPSAQNRRASPNPQPFSRRYIFYYRCYFKFIEKPRAFSKNEFTILIVINYYDCY